MIHAYMKQARLEQKVEQGTRVTTGWIDAGAARVGNRVELLPDGGVWTVAEVYERPLTKETVKENQLLNRNSLPSVEPMR